MFRSAKPTLPLLAALIALAGCGGGGGGKSNAGTVRAKFELTWEERSRAIQGPASALSAKVILAGAASNGGSLVTVVDRIGTAGGYTGAYQTRAGVRPDTYTLTVRFFSKAGGTGDVVAEGSAQVTVAADGSGIGSVAVSSAVASVEVLPNQVVPVGADVELRFAAKDANGATLALTPGSATWSYSDLWGYLRVTPGGIATGLQAGVDNVQVTVDGKTSAATPVTVSPAPLAALVVDPDQTVVEGETTRLTVTATDAQGHLVNLDRASVQWSLVAGADVLGLSADGTATAKALGTATVRATARGKTSAPAGVRVVPSVDVPTVPTSAPYFVHLAPGDGHAYVIAVDADGSTVVGVGNGSDYSVPDLWEDPLAVATEWPSEPGPSAGILVAVTDDGQVALGQTDYSLFAGIPALFYRDGHRLPLALPAGKSYGIAQDLSADGSVALCTDAAQTAPFDPRPYLLYQGAASYLPIPAGAANVRVAALSGDGSAVVGTIDGRAVRWVNGGSPEFLATQGSGAQDVSRDGRVVVGNLAAGTGGTVLPFRWTEGGGPELLPVPSTYATTVRVVAVSAHGATVLMMADEPGGPQFIPLLWRQGQGTKTLKSLFAAAGGEIATFDGTLPMALSADGKTVIGRGKADGPGSPRSGNWKLRLP